MRPSAELEWGCLPGHRDVERVRVVEDTWVALRGLHACHDERACRDVQALVVEVLGCEPEEARYRRAPAYDLFDRLCGQLRMLSQQRPLCRVLGEGDHGVGELVAG